MPFTLPCCVPDLVPASPSSIMGFPVNCQIRGTNKAYRERNSCVCVRLEYLTIWVCPIASKGKIE